MPSGGAPGGEDAVVPLISGKDFKTTILNCYRTAICRGAAVSLALPAVVVAGAVNSRIQEKKREDAERRAREAADPTGSILQLGAFKYL